MPGGNLTPFEIRFNASETATREMPTAPVRSAQQSLWNKQSAWRQIPRATRERSNSAI
jgi:anti-sigma-K factor RskA